MAPACGRLVPTGRPDAPGGRARGLGSPLLETWAAERSGAPEIAGRLQRMGDGPFSEEGPGEPPT